MAFAYFIQIEEAAPAVDPRHREHVAALLRGLPGLRRGLVMTPPAMAPEHRFAADGPGPALSLQLDFDSIEALEAAAAADGPLRALAEIPVLAGRHVTQQAMLRRVFPVPNPTPAKAPPHCTFLVHYPGPAADVHAWLDHYISHHPAIMARFEGIRQVEIFTRIDWRDGMPWTRRHHMQRNKVVFDDLDALIASLASPVMIDMRADFLALPPFEGGNGHFANETWVV